MGHRHLIATLWLATALGLVSESCSQDDTWLDRSEDAGTVSTRISPPDGYERIDVDSSSFAYWLRNLPLKDYGAPVRLYDGRRKRNQKAHVAVIDIDVGTQDLQQCADAVIRLRSEYFFSRGHYDSIGFDFTSGDRASFRRWINGVRPKVRGNEVAWSETGVVDSSYRSFRKYLNVVFSYAGSYSLSREMKAMDNVCEVEGGDVFIQGGFPGHAVIVVDVAVNKTTGERIFLLAQSFMPAQDIHILKNPSDVALSPWYDCEFGEKLQTPEWEFTGKDLKRF